MEFQIETAQRHQAKLRIGLAAPSGAGKTYSALQLAYGLTNDWRKIVVIDTEQGSASMYSDLGEYKVLKLTPPFTPERYIGALEAAENAGFEVIIIDSISHAWMGKGGLLEDHEQLGVRDSYFKMTKPRHRRIIERILQSTSHVIVTVRTKQGFAISQEGDKSKVQKMGLDPITESNFDYEMTVYIDIGMNHMGEASKDRTKIFMKPGEIQHPTIITPETGKMLKSWAEKGIEAPKRIEVPPPKPVAPATPDFIEELEEEAAKPPVTKESLVAQVESLRQNAAANPENGPEKPCPLPAHVKQDGKPMMLKYRPTRQSYSHARQNNKGVWEYCDGVHGFPSDKLNEDVDPASVPL